MTSVWTDLAAALAKDRDLVALGGPTRAAPLTLIQVKGFYESKSQ